MAWREYNEQTIKRHRHDLPDPRNFSIGEKVQCGCGLVFRVYRDFMVKKWDLYTYGLRWSDDA